MRKTIYLIWIVLTVSAISASADNVYMLAGIINQSPGIELHRFSLIGPYPDVDEDTATGNEYSVNFYSGVIELKQFYFNVSQSEEPDLPEYFIFSVVIPANADKMVFKQYSSIMYEHYFSANAPQISNLNVVPNGDNYSVSWTASDIDGDTLSYNVYYSVNNGAFRIFLKGYDMASIDVPSSAFPQGEIRLKIESFDGFNTAEIISAPFIVGNNAPFVFILSPNTNSAFMNGTNIDFAGWVYDTETENITSYNWESSIDGNLGNTTYLSTNLSEGMHKITFSSDDGQSSSNDSINITITTETRPDLSVEKIGLYPEFAEPGTNITLVATIHNIITDAFFGYTLYEGDPSENVLIFEHYDFATANEFTDIYANWNNVAEGEHNVSLVITNITPESDLSNNNIVATIEIYNRQPVKFRQGWNLFSPLFGPKEQKTERNIFLQEGWNLFGYSSFKPFYWLNAEIYDGVLTKTLIEAQTADWLQGTVYYFDEGTYKFVPGNDNYLRKDNGYWIYSNRDNLTLKLSDVGGAYTPASWENITISNGLELKTLSDAVSAHWLQGTVYYFDEGTYKFVPGDDNYTSPWRGYWLYALEDNLTLI